MLCRPLTVLIAGCAPDCVLTLCKDKKWVYVILCLTLLLLKGRSGTWVAKELKQ